MIRRVGCVVLVLLSLAFFLGLLLAAQTVGVEAWHDSAVPAGASGREGVAMAAAGRAGPEVGRRRRRRGRGCLRRRRW